MIDLSKEIEIYQSLLVEIKLLSFEDYLRYVSLTGFGEEIQMIAYVNYVKSAIEIERKKKKNGTSN